MRHSIKPETFRPGTRVIVFDAWMKNPKHAVIIKVLGSMFISDDERGIRHSTDLNRTWLADDLFGPVIDNYGKIPQHQPVNNGV